MSKNKDLVINDMLPDTGNPRKDLDNPETFILQGVLLMAQQSLDPESYEIFAEAYHLLCVARSAKEFI